MRSHRPGGRPALAAGNAQCVYRTLTHLEDTHISDASAAGISRGTPHQPRPRYTESSNALTQLDVFS